MNGITFDVTYEYIIRKQQTEDFLNLIKSDLVAKSICIFYKI